VAGGAGQLNLFQEMKGAETLREAKQSVTL